MGNKSSRHSLHLLCNRIWRLSVNTTLKHLRQDLLIRLDSAMTNTKSDLGRVDTHKRFCETLFYANSRRPILRKRHPLSHRSPPKKGKVERLRDFRQVIHPTPSRNKRFHERPTPLFIVRGCSTIQLRNHNPDLERSCFRSKVEGRERHLCLKCLCSLSNSLPLDLQGLNSNINMSSVLHISGGKTQIDGEKSQVSKNK